MPNKIEDFRLHAESLTLDASEAPWDTAAFGFHVAKIDCISLHNAVDAHSELPSFKHWVESNDIRLISCRLSCQKLIESMFLEGLGFRFVEMVLHPGHSRLADFSGCADPDLMIEPPEKGDLPELKFIAESAFTNERYYVDPRIGKGISGKRYGNWLSSAFGHATQTLLKAVHEERLVAFFVVERRNDGSAYWHLTAVNPRFQRMGYGRRVWGSMLARHHEEGVDRVSTTIAARNIAVLNLYSTLGFRFAPPEMTFHWIRDGRLSSSTQPVAFPHGI